MKRPYITLKFAQTLDGKIAAKDGSSKWISSSRARKFAHKLRATHDAILVGSKTVLKDNPSLTTRLFKGKNPVRVIIDRKLRTPLNSKILSTRLAKTIIVTTKKAPQRKIEILKKRNIEFIISNTTKSGNINLSRLMNILYLRNIKSVLVEGGRKTIALFLKRGLANKIIIIISPKILGSGVESIDNLGITNIKSALKVRLKDIKRIGEDIIYTALC